MTLQEAYQGWQQQQQNRALFAKTREAFRKVWSHLQPDQPCQYYTKQILGEALALSDQAEENKAKAASVMIHVLTYAHQQEPADNPKPRFTFGDLMACAKQQNILNKDYKDCKEPAADQTTPNPSRSGGEAAAPENNATEDKSMKSLKSVLNKKICESQNNPCQSVSSDVKESSEALPPGVEVKKQICQLDLRTLKVLKTWETPFHIKRELGIHNVRRAIERCGIAGGFYWSFAADVDTFADRLAASRDHKVQVRADHCAQMRAAKVSKNILNKDYKDCKEPAADQTTPNPSCSALPLATDEGRKNSGGEAAAPEKKNLRDLSVSVVNKQSVAQEQSVSSVSSDANKSSDAKKPSVVQQALAVFTDDELFAELDRRGWFGYFSRTEIVTIGAKT